MESRNCIERKELYRRILFLVLMLFSFTLLFAKGGTQQGIAYLYDYKTKTKKPIANVQLTVAGAKPTTSHADGTFTLVFELFGMGDKITHSKQPYYQGLKVFNKKEVDNWYIVKGKIRLIMCKYEEFELAKNTYYQLGMKAAKDKYDQQIRQIKANHKLKEAEMRQQLQEAEENYLRAMELMSESSEEMARIDQSELDDEMREILDLYEHGNVEEAMTKLKSLQLADEFDKRTAKIDEQQKEIEELDSDLLVIIEQMRVAIPALKNQGEWEEAGKYLKRIAEKTKTFDDFDSYISYCYDFEKFDEAKKCIAKLRKILNDCDKDLVDGFILSQEGSLALMTNNAEEAREKLSLACNVFELASMSDNRWEAMVAGSLSGLAGYYIDKNENEKSAEIADMILSIFERHSSEEFWKEPNVLRLKASALLAKAVALKRTNRIADSEIVFTDALAFCKENDILSVRSQIYRQMVDFYGEQNKYQQCAIMCNQAIEFYEGLAQAQKLPRLYRDYVHVLEIKSFLEAQSGNYELSQRLLFQSIEICKRYLNLDSYENMELLARELGSYASCCVQKKEYKKAIQAFDEVLPMARQLVNLAPNQYHKEQLAINLGGYGELNRVLHDYVKSEKMLKEACDILKELNSLDSLKYAPSLISTQFCLSALYGVQLRFLECKALVSEIQQYAKKFVYVNPALYKFTSASLKGITAFRFLFEKKYKESEQYAREGIIIDSSQHWIVGNLAASLLFQGKYDEAEKIYREYKNELKDGFLDDFKQFEEVGIIPEDRKADVEKIKKILTE